MLSNDETRECWLAQSGETHEGADREGLALTEDAAEGVLDEWREQLGSEGRWYSTVRMRAMVVEE